MNIWQTAKQMAIATPDNRNRYVDFLRAMSIMIVVTGHWFIAGFVILDKEVTVIEVLALLPEIQWLTWLFQVMPIFFIVGGYANAVSLASAQKKDLGYAEWLATRLDRLVRPLIPLIALWALLASTLFAFGANPDHIQLMTQLALIPIWFLAIYTIVVMLAPLTYSLWQKLGMGSVILFVALAAFVDGAVFLVGFDVLGWTNYFWIWLAVHQLGYAWQGNRFDNRFLKPLLTSVAAWALLYCMVKFGPYPLAMVGSPDEDISNTLPPKLPLLVLGIAQFSLLLMLEAPINRLLKSVRIWAATVLVNSMIMTLYLWHISVMILVVFGGWLLGGVGFSSEPGTSEWWLTRPIWIFGLYLLLFPFALLLSPIERSMRPPNWNTNGITLVAGAVMICLGIAVLSMFGMANSPVPLLDITAVVLIFLGALISGVIGLGKRSRSEQLD